MAKQTIKKKKTTVTIKSKSSGSKRCPNCGKFMNNMIEKVAQIKMLLSMYRGS